MSTFSASNYIASSGQNLDDIFEKRNSQQDKADATNYYNTDGQDLNVIFLPLSSNVATTTNYKVKGSDLNTIFEALNTSTVGSILIWPTTTAPTNYLLCDGSSYSTTDTKYSSLYSAIGTTYGYSSGSFKVPNFTNNSKTFMSSTYSNYTGGNNSLDLSQSDYGIDWATHNHTLDTSSIDFSHSHSISSVGSNTQYTGAVKYVDDYQLRNNQNERFLRIFDQGGLYYLTSNSNSTTATFDGSSDQTPSTTTSTIEILNPYITINYIIKYQ